MALEVDILLMTCNNQHSNSLETGGAEPIFQPLKSFQFSWDCHMTNITFPNEFSSHSVRITALWN